LVLKWFSCVVQKVDLKYLLKSKLLRSKDIVKKIKTKWSKIL